MMYLFSDDSGWVPAGKARRQRRDDLPEPQRPTPPAGTGRALSMTTMTQEKTVERPRVNEAFALPASPDAVERAAEALRGHGFTVYVVDGADAARDLALSLIPEGSEVGQGASQTMTDIGVTQVVETSGRYDAIRPKTRAMDRATRGREIRKLAAAPDFWLNSVQAVTEDGRLVIASASGSQLGPIASGAGQVILVAGSQKIVPDLDTAFRRLDEYAVPLEDFVMQRLYGRHTALNKMLILNGDGAGRYTVILVREPVGR
jgi:hypothetical protein